MTDFPSPQNEYRLLPLDEIEDDEFIIDQISKEQENDGQPDTE